MSEAMATPSVDVVVAPHCSLSETVPLVVASHSRVVDEPAAKVSSATGAMKAFCAAVKAAKRPTVARVMSCILDEY